MPNPRRETTLQLAVPKTPDAMPPSKFKAGAMAIAKMAAVLIEASGSPSLPALRTSPMASRMSVHIVTTMPVRSPTLTTLAAHRPVLLLNSLRKTVPRQSICAQHRCCWASGEFPESGGTAAAM